MRKEKSRKNRYQGWGKKQDYGCMCMKVKEFVILGPKNEKIKNLIDGGELSDLYEYQFLAPDND